ncbi:MAG: GNAT family N-acetyltransferase [Pseudonocardiaceae bacterium]
MRYIFDRSRITPVRVSPHTLDEPIALLDECATWLRGRGIDEQWPISFSNPDPDDPRDRIEELWRYAALGHLWVMRDHNERGGVLGMMVVSHLPDFDFAPFWPGAVQGHHYGEELWNAHYLYRMAVRRDVIGQGLGAMMVDFALWLSRNTGMKYLRLDCSKTNIALHAHYKRLGFEHITTAEVPGRKSGALFQREVSPR